MFKQSHIVRILLICAVLFAPSADAMNCPKWLKRMTTDAVYRDRVMGSTLLGLTAVGTAVTVEGWEHLPSPFREAAMGFYALTAFRGISRLGALTPREIEMDRIEEPATPDPTYTRMGEGNLSEPTGFARYHEGDPGEISDRGNARQRLKWYQATLRNYATALFVTGILSGIAVDVHEANLRQQEVASFKLAGEVFSYWDQSALDKVLPADVPAAITVLAKEQIFRVRGKYYDNDVYELVSMLEDNALLYPKLDKKLAELKEPFELQVDESREQWTKRFKDYFGIGEQDLLEDSIYRVRRQKLVSAIETLYGEHMKRIPGELVTIIQDEEKAAAKASTFPTTPVLKGPLRLTHEGLRSRSRWSRDFAPDLAGSEWVAFESDTPESGYEGVGKEMRRWAVRNGIPEVGQQAIRAIDQEKVLADGSLTHPTLSTGQLLAIYGAPETDGRILRVVQAAMDRAMGEAFVRFLRAKGRDTYVEAYEVPEEIKAYIEKNPNTREFLERHFRDAKHFNADRAAREFLNLPRGK